MSTSTSGHKCYEEIRDVVRILLDGCKWHFINFEDFTSSLEESGQKLLEVMKRRTCVVIDHLRKSSLWVFVLILHLIKRDDELKQLFDARKHNLSLLVLFARPRQFGIL